MDERHLPPSRVKRVGYWTDVDRPDLPDPADFVDTTWDVSERELVAAYLSAGRTRDTGCGCSPCRICGELNGFEDFTDGVYIWPEGLAHYVLDHAVRLPEALVQHALASKNPVGDVGLVDTSWWPNEMT